MKTQSPQLAGRAALGRPAARAAAIAKARPASASTRSTKITKKTPKLPISVAASRWRPAAAREAAERPQPRQRTRHSARTSPRPHRCPQATHTRTTGTRFGIHLGHLGGPLAEMRRLWRFADEH